MAAVAGFFWYVNAIAPQPGIPIGWDTAYYVRAILSMRQLGIVNTFSQLGGHDLLYPYLASYFPLPPLLIEVLAPVVLSLSVVISYAFLLRMTRRNRIESGLTILALASWVAIYRMGSDLDANLLGLTLAIFGVALLSKGEDSGKVRYGILGLSSFALASFAHVETALFFGLVFSLSSAMTRKRKAGIVIVSLILVLVPATVVFFVHEQSLLSLTSGTLEATGPVTAEYWADSVGIVFPFFAILGLLVCFAQYRIRKYDFYSTFLVCWFFLALVIGLTQYLVPNFESFSSRAILLLPLPMLSVPFLLVMLRKRGIGAALVVALLILGAYNATTYVINDNSALQYVTPSEYNNLTWLAGNLHSSEPPVFVINAPDNYIGGQSDLWDNWIQNLYGNHFTYVGRLDALAALEPTIFTTRVSGYESSRYFTYLESQGLSPSFLSNRPVIILSDFYQDFPARLYANYTTELRQGVYLVNLPGLENSRAVLVPAYQSANLASGGWYYIPKNWTLSDFALEYYSNTSLAASVTIPVYLNSASTYRLGVRLLDGSLGNSIQFMVNGTLVKNVIYNGTGLPVTITLPLELTGDSSAILGIELPAPPTGNAAFASIDCVVVQRISSTTG